ncbi:Multidrug resistance-associated protein [Blattamonas nauphoetae]|uniref:Multidrug resistance-associated protein n=1 Tax=Blattamonas nauphoetae TaxID=2049346 RepID=A0ABQ9X448_9EUKA|nr:Multidrug resistance-associated protein [Blattamonas nauphoetae]
MTNKPEEKPKVEINRKQNHEERYVWLANWFMCFIFPYVCTCHPLMDEDMPVVHKNDAARPATERFMAKFRPAFEKYDKDVRAHKNELLLNPESKTKPPKRPGLLRMEIGTQSSYFMAVGVVALLLQSIMEVLMPYMSKGVLTAIVDKEFWKQSGGVLGSNKFPLFFGIWLIITPTLIGLFSSLSNRMLLHLASRVRASVVCAMYDKAFRIKNMASAGSADTGRILSLVSTDSRMVAEMLPMFFMLFSVPVYFFVPLIFLILDFKWVVVVPLVVSVLVMLPNFVIIGSFMKYMKTYMQYNDQRNRITNETFQGIRVVKYSGLEDVFKATINKPRSLQIHSIKMQTFLFQLVFTIIQFSRTAINIATFAVYCAVYSDDPTNFAAVVMPNMGYLMIMTMPTTMLPMYLEAGMMIRIHSARIAQFLYLPEMEDAPTGDESKPSDPEIAVEIVNGEFKWGAAPEVPLTEAEETAMKEEAEKRKKEAKLAPAKKGKDNTPSPLGLGLGLG